MRFFVLALPFAATAAITAAGCGHGDVPRTALPAVPVRAPQVAAVQLHRHVEAIGSVQSAQEAVLASKVTGTVLEIRKRAGDRVRQGEVVVVLDARDVAGQIAQAEGALAQARAAAVLAEANLQRFETLRTRGSASQLEADQARFQYETARGAVAQAEGAAATARSYQSYAQVEAPFSGQVVDRLCDVGELAAPGRPLLRIEASQRPRLHAALDGEKAVLAAPGTRVEVEIPSLGSAWRHGVVAEVVPAADPGTRSILVKIDLEPEPGLRSGLFARAFFAAGARSAIAIPARAVRQRGGLAGVFLAENGKAAFRLVTTAPAPGDSLEILSGLSAGERVIVDVPAGLEADTPVEVRE